MMNRRHGFTIVEIIATMTIGSALMVLGVGLVHQTLTLSTKSRLRNDHLRSLNRLAQQFRTDVHRSTTCNVASPDRIELVLSDDTVVTFQAAANVVVRSQPIDDGRTRNTQYVLSSGASATFERLDAPDRAVLTAVRSADFTAHESIDRKTEAVIGHLATLEQAEVEK